MAETARNEPAHRQARDARKPQRERPPVNKRGAARMGAVQALYQMDIGKAGLAETVAEYENFRLGREIDGEQYRDADAAWFRAIVAGVQGEQRRIDGLIADALVPGWPLSRIAPLLRAILRCGTYELAEKRDVPARAVISEYVDLARAFFETDEPRMVNGVLDGIARTVREGELPPRPGATE